MRGLTLCPSGCCLYGNIVLPPTDLGCNPEAIDSSSNTVTRPQRFCYLKCEKWSPCPTIYTHYMDKSIGTHLLLIKFRIQVFQPDPLWQVYKNQAPSHAVCIFYEKKRMFWRAQWIPSVALWLDATFAISQLVKFQACRIFLGQLEVVHSTIQKLEVFMNSSKWATKSMLNHRAGHAWCVKNANALALIS